MLPFVVIFLLVGGLLLSAGWHFEREARRSSSWPVVEGKLELCEVVNVPGIQVEDPSSSRLQLRYSYVVRGITYHATRYAFGFAETSIDDEKQQRIANALKRSPLRVRYDPKHPSEAVISTEVQSNLTKLGYGGLVMAAISALIGFAGHW